MRWASTIAETFFCFVSLQILKNDYGILGNLLGQHKSRELDFVSNITVFLQKTVQLSLFQTDIPSFYARFTKWVKCREYPDEPTHVSPYRT